MPKHGKKYRSMVASLEEDKVYGIDEAVEVARNTQITRFDATVELHSNLGIDTRHQDQQVRGTVVLPHGTGRSRRVIAFAAGDAAAEATEAGAEAVGGDDLADRIRGGWLEFDAAVATPDMMRTVGPLGRILGPRGLMPNARAGTVSPRIGEVVSAIKGGQVEYRADQSGNIHFAIGKTSFGAEQLKENLCTALNAVVNARPSGARGTYVRSITLSTSMGPGLPLDVNEAISEARTLA